MTDEKNTAGIHSLMSKVQRELAVGKDEYNKFGGYAFRNAESILKAAKPIITAEGGWLAIEPSVEVVGEEAILTVSVTLYASDGTSFMTSFSGKVAKERKGMVTEQLFGSAYSYYLKYALQALFALSDGDDDPDAKDNRDTGAVRRSTQAKDQKAESPEAAAKRELWEACKALALVTGREAREVAAEVQKQEGFAATVEGYKDAAAKVRKLAEDNGGEYAAEDIDF